MLIVFCWYPCLLTTQGKPSRTARRLEEDLAAYSVCQCMTLRKVVTLRIGSVGFIRLFVYVHMMPYLCARALELYRVVCVGR